MYGGKHKVTNVREDSSQDYTLRELLLCRVTEEGEVDKKVRELKISMENIDRFILFYFL